MEKHLYPPVRVQPHSHTIAEIEGLLRRLSQSSQGPISVVDDQTGVPLFELENTAQDAYTLIKATGTLKGAFHYMEATNNDYIAIQANGPSTGWGIGRVGDSEGLNFYVDPDNTGLDRAGYFDVAKKLFLLGGLDMGSLKIENVATPVSAGDAATKSYVDGLALNLGKRATVRAATTANITIATALNNGDTLDGVTLATGDLVLVKNQSAPAENGVYVVGVTPARDTQFDSYNEHAGSLLVVQEGTTLADTVWLCTSNVGGTLNTTAIAFSQMSVSGALLASNNLSDLANAATARTNLGLTALATTTPGTGVATFLATPTSANLLAALTDETGSGAAVFATSPTLVTPALGTPSALVLTNATGLPASALVASTSQAVGFGTVELGHATDTTLSRAAAGDLAVEGVSVLTTSNTKTMSNKRLTRRVGTTASSATPTINTDNTDKYRITALAAAITSFTTNLTGTPVDGDTLWISITDNGTARAITWGASFEASGNVALPTTTVLSVRLDVMFVWNAATSKWRCVAVA